MLGLWKSASMEIIEEILGLSNLEAMILSSYESLLDQAIKSDDLKHSLEKILQPQEEAIEERYRQLRMKAKQADRTIRERFWWTDTDKFDYIIKLNIYLHCESRHYCYKCEEFHRGNTWLECEHREESWKQILEATNNTNIEEVKHFFKSNTAE